MERQYETLDDLCTAVASAGGVMRCSLFELRHAYGAGKLGVHVMRNIQQELGSRGFGMYDFDPDGAIPLRQEMKVRVYQKRSPVGELIDAVLNPSDAGDRRLIERSGGDHAEILRKIRELVCDG